MTNIVTSVPEEFSTFYDKSKKNVGMYPTFEFVGGTGSIYASNADQPPVVTNLDGETDPDGWSPVLVGVTGMQTPIGMPKWIMFVFTGSVLCRDNRAI